MGKASAMANDMHEQEALLGLGEMARPVVESLALWEHH